MSKGATNVEQAVTAFRACWYLNERKVLVELSAMLPTELDCVIAAAELLADLARDAQSSTSIVRDLANAVIEDVTDVSLRPHDLPRRTPGGW